jgi:hypothetical protein
VILGDNGASAEGSHQGCFNEMAPLTGSSHLETPEFLLERMDKFGGTEAYNHYAVGWTHATNTPYQWTKQVASHFGGTRNGTILHWPKGISARGEVRSMFHHVIDVAPTVDPNDLFFVATAPLLRPSPSSERILTQTGGVSAGGTSACEQPSWKRKLGDLARGRDVPRRHASEVEVVHTIMSGSSGDPAAQYRQKTKVN